MITSSCEDRTWARVMMQSGEAPGACYLEVCRARPLEPGLRRIVFFWEIPEISDVYFALLRTTWDGLRTNLACRGWAGCWNGGC